MTRLYCTTLSSSATLIGHSFPEAVSKLRHCCLKWTWDIFFEYIGYDYAQEACRCKHPASTRQCCCVFALFLLWWHVGIKRGLICIIFTPKLPRWGGVWSRAPLIVMSMKYGLLQGLSKRRVADQTLSLWGGVWSLKALFDRDMKSIRFCDVYSFYFNPFYLYYLWYNRNHIPYRKFLL